MLTAVDGGSFIQLASIDTTRGAIRIRSSVPVERPADREHVVWSPDGRRAALLSPDGFAVSFSVVSLAPGKEGVHPEMPGLYPAWSPDGNRVAYLSETPAGPPGPVFVVDLRNGKVRVSTRLGGPPVWAPDGRHIAFHDSLRHGPVLLVDLRTGKVRRVAASGGQPAWSPDGKWLAWGNARGVLVAPLGGRPRYVFRAKLEAERRVVSWSPDGRQLAVGDVGLDRWQVVDLGTHRRWRLRRPAKLVRWSPDGSHIGYLGHVYGDWGWDYGGLHVVDADGRHDRLLVGSDRSLPTVDDMAWSPDGTRIAFDNGAVGVVRVANGRRQLYASSSSSYGLRWDSATSVELLNTHHVGHVAVTDGASMRLLTSGPWDDGEPAWTADRAMIAFTSDRGGQGTSGIYTMRADGSGIRRLTSGWVPRWSPDGTRVAFESGRGGRAGVWVVNSDRTGMHRLGDGGHPLWSPDGRWLAYVRKCFVVADIGRCSIAIEPADGGGACEAGGNPETMRWSTDASVLELFEPKLSWATFAPDCGLVAMSGDAGSLSPSGWSDPDRPPPCTLAGTDASDSLRAGTGGSIICGFAGDDVIVGGAGHDVVYASDGNDMLDGGPASDWLFGAGGDDTVHARDGDADTVDCGPGNDAVLADPVDAVSPSCERVDRG